MSELAVNRRTAARLLLVDADGGRRAALRRLLAEDGYARVRDCENPDAVARACEDWLPDLVLLDLDHPGLGPGGVSTLLGQFDRSSAVAFLGFTSDGTGEGRLRAVRTGVDDFAVRPVGQEELRLRVNAALARSRPGLGLRAAADPWSADDADLDPGTVRESLEILGTIADFHDDDTSQHAQRVGVLAAAIAGALGLPDPFVALLRQAAPLHDIGKVGISRRILLKPDELSPSEWLHMMSHVGIGAQILESAQSPVFVLAAEIARTHHERWDGSGYTAGLRGEEIPLSGRIAAVADTWDSLTHIRPYRPAWTPEQAVAEIHSQSGGQFDPDVVAAFASLDPQGLALDQTAAQLARATV